jgi:outer membrane cobalamin receptor
MRLLLCGALAASFSATLTSPSSAAVLAGQVHTREGTPVPQLVLVLSGPGGPRTAVTGAEGRFRVSGLAPGGYAVRLETPGFVLTPEPRVEVGDSEARLDLTLDPAPVREHVLVAATRGEAPQSALGITTTVISSDTIARREATSVRQLLEESPGVTTAGLGGLGTQASAFVRGGESRFTRVLVDGVPVNEPGGYHDFGGQLPLELERVEVVRGAASSLYGTDALAGVVHFVSRRAALGESPAVQAEADAGRFAWRRVQAGTSGRRGAFDWNAGGLHVATDQEQPNSAFSETAGAASLGARLGDRSDLRLILRGDRSDTGTPGQVLYGRPDLEDHIERDGVVTALRLSHRRGRSSHELHAGVAVRHQLTLDTADSGPFVARFGDRVAPFESFDFPDPEGFQNDTRRDTFSYQLEQQAGERHLLTAGLDVERESGALGARSDLLSPERTNFGGYVQDRVVLGPRVFATIGGRVEKNASFGTRAVPRAAVAWRARGGVDATTLRASAGEGIKEPSFFESFGVSEFARGNPELRPERSRTFDLGVEQRLLSGRLRLDATAFHHEYRDQIAFAVLSFSPFRGTYDNLGKTRARGAELSVEAAPTDAVSLSAHYTFTDGEILESASATGTNAAGQPLLRRPRHQAALSAYARGGRVALGATLFLMGARPDSDFAGLDLTENPGHARVDLRGRVRLVAGLEGFVVAENVFDREYQDALGYPALGRAVRAGLRFKRGR